MVDTGRVFGVDELTLQAELRVALASDDADRGWRSTVQTLPQDLPSTAKAV